MDKGQLSFMGGGTTESEVECALIQASDRKYTFGSLAYEFYYSGELLDAFSYITE